MVQLVTCWLVLRGTYMTTLVETTNHLLIDCEFSKVMCYWIFRWCGIKQPQFRNVRDFIDFGASCGNCPRKGNILTMILHSTIWNIWIARNDKVFKKLGVNPTKTTDCIISQAFEWNKYMGNGLESWADRNVSPLL